MSGGTTDTGDGFFPAIGDDLGDGLAEDLAVALAIGSAVAARGQLQATETSTVGFQWHLQRGFAGAPVAIAVHQIGASISIQVDSP